MTDLSLIDPSGVFNTSTFSYEPEENAGVRSHGYDHRQVSDRLPFMLMRDSSPTNILSFWVNPSESQWSIATRTTIEKVAGGAIHHEWPQIGLGSQGASVFDQPVVRFAFQSGIITPYGYQHVGSWGKPRSEADKEKDYIPPGIGNFYQFMTILSDTNVTPAGTPNYVNILYLSATFPALWLRGFFTPDGVSWTDTADNPYQVNAWGASFEVFSSTPALNDSAQLRGAFRALGFNG